MSRRAAAVADSSPHSPTEDSSSTTRLTPDSASASDGEDSDLEMGESEMGESFKLRELGEKGRRGAGAGADGVDDEDEDEDFDDGDDEDGERYREEGGEGRRGRGRGRGVYELYTPEEERAVVRKFDRKLVLFVALLYMLSFLDRSNIGNARIAGLDVDLNLTSPQFEWVLTTFYIAYILFEWSSILFTLIPAHIYITLIVLSWGVIASLQSIATSFTQLLILRTLLGIGEAGFTGIPFYLSFFYNPNELALRTGFFISAAPLATSFASSLAWGIIYLGQHSPIAPWRLLFLLEGFPSVLVAVMAYHIIPDSPSSARYLTRRERKVAVLRLRRKEHKTSSHLNPNEMLTTLLDPKNYLTAFMFFFTNMAFSSLPVFLPTIIRSMGHSSLTSQALSAPPYLCAFVSVLLTSYLSDRYRSRSTFIIIHALLSLSGYLTLSLASSTWVRYAAIYPSAIGFFSVITLIITWTINNQQSESGQGTGFAVMQIVGQLGPLVGTRLYPESDAPYYRGGMRVCAMAMACVVLLAAGLRFWLGVVNRRLEREEGGGGEESGDDVGEEGEGLVGDTKKRRRRKEAPFRYML